MFTPPSATTTVTPFKTTEKNKKKISNDKINNQKRIPILFTYNNLI